MIKKTMVLADHDGLYLNQLSNYFMENAPQLELNLFTSEEMLAQYLNQGMTADILVVDEGFAFSAAAKQANAGAKIVLSATMDPVDGFELVKKYQKTGTLLNEIMLKYAECTGSVEAIKGQSNTKTAAFYSPAGGTGKTTLALGMAAACARAGLRTLYLNLEEIDSVKYVLGQTPGSLSDIFLALKTKGMNVGIKLASCVGQEHTAGFFYLTGVESISEYEEITGDDISRLLDMIKGMSEYDVMILDLSSGFSEKTRKTLEHADVIFTPVVSEEGCIAKMNRLLGEADLHNMYNSVLEKMSLVVNRSSMSGVGRELQESRLLDRVNCGGNIATAPVFMRRADVLRSGDMLLDMLNPMLQFLMNR